MSKPGVCLMAIMCSVGMTSLQLTSGIKDSDRWGTYPKFCVNWTFLCLRTVQMVDSARSCSKRSTVNVSQQVLII